MTGRQRDIILGMVIIALFSFVYLVIIPREVPVLSPVSIPATSPDFWPKNITLLLVFLGAYQLCSAILRPDRQDSRPRSRAENLRDLFLVIILLAYGVAVPTLGMLLTSTLAILACMLLFKERRPLVLIACTLLLPSCMHFFLVKIAKILIPAGILPF